ncbi:hypothetical protein FACS1894113_3890 [Alphaproteobacteria bacterium]|nr:hypothetical protein FACS1894113_3890 [Alphaproteobacteria bacterium]
MLRIGNTTELTNADAQNFRNAVIILLQKLAIQSVGGRSNVGETDIDDVISNDICFLLDGASFGKST